MFDRALLFVGIKMRSPSCRKPGSATNVDSCSSHTRNSSTLLSMSRSFRDSRATAYKIEAHQRASRTLHLDLRSATSASVRLYADRMIEHSEKRVSRFPPDAQTRPTIRSRVNSKKRKSRNWFACNTLCQQTRELELGMTQGPINHNRGSGFALHNCQGVNCSDRDSCNANFKGVQLFGW